ncbi:MAG TPA: MOSC N-terminal beta barrel domain-containing protein [Nostocaceae cyanobacterium]|nr:MOSC N-terminal beta barrel domain-containing protein [Nostocaceae cyanobacterium]
MSYLAKILIYPIKSLDGVEVETVKILPSGALAGDRQFAIIDEQGKFVNAKRNDKIHLLRSEFCLESQSVSLQIPGSSSKQVFHLDADRQELATALSDFFGFAVTLIENKITGFPDDTNYPGATVISVASLTEVASWFPGVSVEEMRRRIRANIEIDGVPAFWEDQLFADSEEPVSFVVGDVIFWGIQPCPRCVVPTRDANTGAVYPNFQKIFVEKRQATMPAWTAKSRFSHVYSLSINTRLPASETGKILQLGNKIEICK